MQSVAFRMKKLDVAEKCLALYAFYVSLKTLSFVLIPRTLSHQTRFSGLGVPDNGDSSLILDGPTLRGCVLMNNSR